MFDKPFNLLVTEWYHRREQSVALVPVTKHKKENEQREYTVKEN